jgi:hypothetical protein
VALYRTVQRRALLVTPAHLVLHKFEEWEGVLGKEGAEGTLYGLPVLMERRQ